MLWDCGYVPERLKPGSFFLMDKDGVRVDASELCRGVVEAMWTDSVVAGGVVVRVLVVRPR